MIIWKLGFVKWLNEIKFEYATSIENYPDQWYNQ